MFKLGKSLQYVFNGYDFGPILLLIYINNLHRIGIYGSLLILPNLCLVTVWQSRYQWTNVKYLGIILDFRLRSPFGTAQKLSSIVGILGKLRNYIPTKVLRLYSTLESVASPKLNSRPFLNSAFIQCIHPYTILGTGLVWFVSTLQKSSGL